MLHTLKNQEVTQKLLPRARKLYVGAQSNLCEMYKLFIQQYGQIQEKNHTSKSF